MKYAMVIDSRRCINCKACMVSCKTANAVPAGQWRNWVKEATPEVPAPSAAQGGPTLAHYQPGACMHCDKPICVAVCPSGATRRNDATGEVTIDRSLCIGCGSCLRACPYDARFKHALLNVADKCDYCANRRAQGLAPACVGTCPTKARIFGDIDDPASEAARFLARGDAVRVENTQTPTGPNMLYIKATAPMDWTRPAEEPASMYTLTRVAQPLVKVITGLTVLGVAASFIRSLVLPDSDPGHCEEESSKQGGSHE